MCSSSLSLSPPPPLFLAYLCIRLWIEVADLRAVVFDQDGVKNHTRFVSQQPAKVVLSTMEVVAQSMGFKTHIRHYKVTLHPPPPRHP